MVNMSAKFDKEIHIGLVCMAFTSLFPYINRVHPLTMANKSAEFDKEIHNGLVTIVFTSLFPYMSIMTLTFDLWPPQWIGSIL